MSKELFQQLRDLAAEARNKKLKEVRAEYSEAIADIAKMEQKLIGKPVAVRPKSKTDTNLVDLVASVIPSDRAVTADDVCGLLRAVDPERQFNLPTIRTTLHRLCREKTLKKTSNPQHGQKVVYCLPGFDLPEVRPLADWAEQILREREEPMKAVEIMVAMTEAGYEMQCPPAEAVKHLEKALAKANFHQSSGGWRPMKMKPSVDRHDRSKSHL